MELGVVASCSMGTQLLSTIEHFGILYYLIPLKVLLHLIAVHAMILNIFIVSSAAINIDLAVVVVNVKEIVQNNIENRVMKENWQKFGFCDSFV